MVFVQRVDSRTVHVVLVDEYELLFGSDFVGGFRNEFHYLFDGNGFEFHPFAHYHRLFRFRLRGSVPLLEDEYLSGLVLLPFALLFSCGDDFQSEHTASYEVVLLESEEFLRESFGKRDLLLFGRLHVRDVLPVPKVLPFELLRPYSDVLHEQELQVPVLLRHLQFPERRVVLSGNSLLYRASTDDVLPVGAEHIEHIRRYRVRRFARKFVNDVLQASGGRSDRNVLSFYGRSFQRSRIYELVGAYETVASERVPVRHRQVEVEQLGNGRLRVAVEVGDGKPHHSTLNPEVVFQRNRILHERFVLLLLVEYRFKVTEIENGVYFPVCNDAVFLRPYLAEMHVNVEQFVRRVVWSVDDTGGLLFLLYRFVAFLRGYRIEVRIPHVPHLVLRHTDFEPDEPVRFDGRSSVRVYDCGKRVDRLDFRSGTPYVETVGNLDSETF